MPWIHEQPGWPELTWDGNALSATLADVRHRQGHLLGRVERLGFKLRQEATLETLTGDVVKTSAIEGENLDAGEVRSSIARRLGLEAGGMASPGRDVEGIVEVMLDATRNARARLTAERLHNWHAALFPTGRSGITPITVAGWRPVSAGPMRVVSGPVGREKVHFQAPEAERVPEEMRRFLDWYEIDQGIDPVIKAGLAHFLFATIHPFEDGNGRIARAIADMSLARSDGTADRFYSMSTQIEAERRMYYEALETQQRNGLDVTPWLEWFLHCLGRALGRAREVLQEVLFKAAFWEIANREGVNERQRRVLNRLLDGFQGYLRTSKYARMAKCSPDTALRDIRELVERGLLVQNPGGGRSTSYRLPAAAELEAVK